MGKKPQPPKVGTLIQVKAAMYLVNSPFTGHVDPFELWGAEPKECLLVIKHQENWIEFWALRENKFGWIDLDSWTHIQFDILGLG
jgi:hypothetical protein